MLGNDLNNWKRLGTFETIGNNPDPVTTNAPPDTDSWGVVTVLSANNTSTAPTIQLFNPLNHISGGTRPLYYRFFRDVWTEWRKLAFATPPQEFDLPPAEGWTYTHTWDKSCYCKTQENIVIVHFALDNSNATQPPDAGYVIAYLPEGFRPSAAVIGTCGDYNHSGKNLYQCWVQTDGAIIVYSPEVVPRGASGTLVFVADS